MIGNRKTNLLISVIVPVYNVEPYIERCIESIVGQTYKNLEIILVDDGSIDNSGIICDEYAQKDRRIKVIHKKNGGLVSSRKAGILMASGEYTTYVDSDDWVEKDSYEKLVKIVEIYHSDIITFGFNKEYLNFSIERNEILSQGIYNNKRFWCEVEKSIKKKNFFCPVLNISVWSKLFRTKLLREYQLNIDDDIRIGEDIAVTFPIALKAKDIYVYKECLYHYCVRKKSITWNKGEDEFKSYLKLVSILVRTWDMAGGDREYLIQILYFYLIICAPEYCFREKECILFPEVKENDNVLIYGKGVFASNLIGSIKEFGLFNIIDCIDKKDAFRLDNLPRELYDYIIIAITDYSSVEDALTVLKKLDVEENKLLYIKKENLCLEKLPKEVKSILVEKYFFDRIC